MAAPPLVIKPGLEIPASELSWKFSRSSGPGGQSVNTSDSRATLSFDLQATPSLPDDLRDRACERLAGRLVDGVISVSSEQERSQLRNREVAAGQLAQLLREAIAVPPPKRRPTKPSRSSDQRRIDSKKKRGDTKKLRQRNHDD